MIVMICICSMLGVTGCNGIFGGSNKDSNLAKRGMQYYFDDEIYDTVISEIMDYIEFNAPSMEGMVKDNLRMYYGENNALIVWLGDEDKTVTKDKIINKYSEDMIDNIEEIADIEDVGVEFNMELLAKDTVNNIARNKYVGEINAIGKDGIDAELSTVVYTYKIGDRPGYVMGIVTNRSQEKNQFTEIEMNAQIMVNTIKRK